MMLKCLIFICLLHLKIIHNKQCGCSVDRLSSKSQDYKNFISLLDTNAIVEDNCPVNDNTATKYKSSEEMVLVPEGIYQLGTDDIVIENDKEGPKRMIKVNSFYLDKYEVSNRDYNNFVKSTNYKTEAETFGDSFVFTAFLNSTFKESLKDFRVVQATWWYKVVGANWRHPHGPDSNILDIMEHPVIHVSWKDAQAFCHWRGARLPTEAEWEAACRGGHRDTKYPWGDKLFPDRKHMANIWQGTFPNHNSVKDGYIGTSPVTMFLQNDFGLHNMAGNVWEWTSDTWSNVNPQEKVKKGGSYLCHRSYCYRYRCSARAHNTEDSSAGNLGFRCAKSA